METHQAKKTNTGILFPHQLFEESGILANCGTIYLVEEFLFFRQFQFHKQKFDLFTAPTNTRIQVLQSYIRSEQIRNISLDTFLCFCDQHGTCLEEGTIEGLVEENTRLAVIYVTEVSSKDEVLCETIITPTEGKQMHRRCPY